MIEEDGGGNAISSGVFVTEDLSDALLVRFEGVLDLSLSLEALCALEQSEKSCSELPARAIGEPSSSHINGSRQLAYGQVPRQPIVLTPT